MEVGFRFSNLQLPPSHFQLATGRWLTCDPIGYDGGINLYAFCGNDPVNFADPWGLFRVGLSCGGVAAFGLGAYANLTAYIDLPSFNPLSWHYDGSKGSIGFGAGPALGYSAGWGVSIEPSGNRPIMNQVITPRITRSACRTTIEATGPIIAFAGIGGGESASVSGPMQMTTTYGPEIPYGFGPDIVMVQRPDVTTTVGPNFLSQASWSGSYKLGPTWGGGVLLGMDLAEWDLSG